MSMFHVTAGSVIVTTSLLLASALLASQKEDKTPVAQMNRALYAAPIARKGAPVAHHLSTGTEPHAQMNRAGYIPRIGAAKQ